jgi:hypothetical protein
MDKIKLESFDLQIQLATILGEENEYLELIRKRRNFKIDYLLREDKIEKEKDYFDDDND